MIIALFDREFEGHGLVSRILLCATLVKQSQFINLFIQLFKFYNKLYSD